MENLTDEKYIALICNGEFDTIPGFIIGELFELFFDKINYNVVRQFDRVFVDFTGETICNDRDSKILIRFDVNGEKEEFAIVFVKVDNEILGEEDVMDLLDNIAFVAETVWEEENGIYEKNDSDNIDELEIDEADEEAENDDDIYEDFYGNINDNYDDLRDNPNDDSDKKD